MPYYYGIDMTYVVLVLPFVLLSLWASGNVNRTFRKYSRQHSVRRLTGAEAAQRVLMANGVSGVRIERIGGNLTDHFDPRTNVIRLSDDVYGNTSTAAIGVACHEAGILFSFLGRFSDVLIYMGLAAFAMSLVFQLVPLPVEFNASHRAMQAIAQTNLLTEEEQKGARKTLTAAAMTYVAATAVALTQLLRLILLFGNRRRDD